MAAKENKTPGPGAPPSTPPALQSGPRPGVLARIASFTGLFCVLGAFGWAVARRYFEFGSIALAGLGVLLFLASFVQAETANLKHYLSSSAYTIFVAGTCVVLYLAFARHDVRADLTSFKAHTLTEISSNYLSVLHKDVEIVVFDVEREPYGLIDLFTQSSPRVRWELHDPLADPEFTLGFGESVSNRLIYIRHGETTKRISRSELNESALVSAIVEVTRERAVRVYFLSGHGELTFDPPKPLVKNPIPSLSVFAEFLNDRAIEVAPLDLSDTGFVPDDASLLVLAGPRSDLFPSETLSIAQYLNHGGSLLVLFDLPVSNQSVKFDNLAKILFRYGLEDREQIVLDYRGIKTTRSGVAVPMDTYNPDHPITESITGFGASTYLSRVRGLAELDDKPKDVRLIPLVRSSPEAWLEPFMRAFSQKVVPPPEAERGQQTLGWGAERRISSGGVSRVVVFGTSALVRDGFIEANQSTVAPLMAYSVDWLVEQEDMIRIPTRKIPGTPLILTNAELQLILIVVTMAFPLAIIFGGSLYASRYRRA